MNGNKDNNLLNLLPENADSFFPFLLLFSDLAQT